MGLFFTNEDKGKYFLIHRRKSVLIFIPLILFFLLIFLFPFFESTFLVVLSMILFYSIVLLGFWMGLEGIYYGFFLPRAFAKQGKKIDKKIAHGIKIFK